MQKKKVHQLRRQNSWHLQALAFRRVPEGPRPVARKRFKDKEERIRNEGGELGPSVVVGNCWNSDAEACFGPAGDRTNLELRHQTLSIAAMGPRAEESASGSKQEVDGDAPGCWCRVTSEFYTGAAPNASTSTVYEVRSPATIWLRRTDASGWIGYTYVQYCM
jgi:hypothetical protein